MYAQGKKALAICDRCGFTYRLKDLRYEVQNKQKNDVNDLSTIDPQSLYDPRVDTGEADSRRLFAFDPIGGGITELGSKTVGLDITGEIGTITVST